MACHAQGVHDIGLIEHYRVDDVSKHPIFNHPPFLGECAALLWAFSQRSGIGFGILFRLPTAIADLLTAYLLTRFFIGSAYRPLVFVAYWLNPLAIIFSAYHGNTDSLVPSFVLLGILLAAAGRPLLRAPSWGSACG